MPIAKGILKAIKERTEELQGLAPQVPKVYEFPGHPCISTVTVTPVAEDNFTVSILDMGANVVTPMDLWGDEVTGLLEEAFTAESKIGVLPLEGAVHFLNGVADAEAEASSVRVPGPPAPFRTADPLVPCVPGDAALEPAPKGQPRPSNRPLVVEVPNRIPLRGQLVIRVNGRQVSGRIIFRSRELIAVQLDDPPTAKVEESLPADHPQGLEKFGEQGAWAAVVLMAKMARAVWDSHPVLGHPSGLEDEIEGGLGGDPDPDDLLEIEGQVIVWIDEDLEAKLRGRGR